jgi:hypothetical protein
LEILRRNLERVVDEDNQDENDEKYALSLSIVNFLKTCTKSDKM